MADRDKAATCSEGSFQARACPADSRVGSINANVSATLTIPILDLIEVQTSAPGDIYRIAAPGSEDVMGIGIVLRPNPVTIWPVTIRADSVLLRGSVRLRSAASGGSDQAALRAVISDMPSTTGSNFGGVEFWVESLSMTMFGQLSNGQRFLSNPTQCSNRSTGVTVVPKSGGTWSGSATFAAPTNCGSLTHAPTTAISAATPDMDKGTGMTVAVNYDDPLNRAANGGTGGRVKAHPKRVSVQLPEGVEFNPPGAAAITQCTDGQFNVGSSGADGCPKGSPTSVIGTATIQSAIIGTLSGNVYFGQPNAGSPLVRLFIAVNQNGIRIKLVGDVAVNHTTGQITATFDNLPQTPFTNFTMTFTGGNAAVLRTPRSCSPTAHQMTSSITPYGGNTASPSAALSITGDCHPASRFAPTVSQAPSTSFAGADTNWTLTMTRPQGDARFTSAAVSLPTGLVGKLGSVTPCSTASANAGTCPASSRVGVVQTQSGDSPSSQATLNGEIFLTAAPAGAIAGLSMKVPAIVGPVNLGNVIVPMKILLRDDYGLDIVADSIPTRRQGIPLVLREIQLNMNQTAGNTANPFMINGTICTPGTITADLDSDQSTSASPTTTYEPTGCPSVPFSPSVGVNPGATLSPVANAPPDTASAISLGVSMPANQSAVRDLTLNLPTGVELNPFSATTLRYCSAAQFNVSSLAPDGCAANSRLGTVSITTPSVGTVTGYAYFGAPTPDSPILRMFIMAQNGPGTNAIRLKFAGDVAIDPTNGRMSATFTDLPAIQFTQMTVSFNGGSSAPLRTPRECGGSSMTSTLSAHAGVADATPSTTLTTSGCGPTTFTPTLEQARSTQAAGADTSMTLTITRNGSDARLSSTDISLPSGVIGKLSSVTPCPTANANAGTCPGSSQIGTVQTHSGDTALTSAVLNGQLYLTEAPAGAIAGLSVVVPAIVGDVNLGTVIVPMKIKLRAGDYGLDIAADSIPLRKEGVPLLLRQMQITIDRTAGDTGNPFMINTTSCEASAIGGAFGSDRSTNKNAFAAYQADSCGSLAFSPAVAVNPAATLTPAATATADTASAMSVGVSIPSGSSAVKDLTLDLPDGVELNPYAATQLRYCSAAQFDTTTTTPDACAANTELGTVSLVVPHIGTLTGHAYFGAPEDDSQILRLFVMAEESSDTDAIRIKLVGDISIDEMTGRMTTTFTDLPAIQFTDMTLNFSGGDAAALRAPRSCGASSMTSTLAAHAGSPDATPSADITTTGCAATTFSPTLTKTASSTAAGQDTTLNLTMARDYGDARFTSASVEMPAGLVGKLGSVTPCPTVHANAGTCPASSQIGVVDTTTGDGPTREVNLQGSIYLTKAPAGAVAGLSVDVRALVGDVDLGDVIVPMKIVLRPSDYGLNIVADSIPTRVRGVPLLLQSMELNIDRTAGDTSDPFMINSPNCSAGEITASFDHDRSGSDTAAVDYEATDCSTLAFNPTVAFNPADDLTPVATASPDAASAMTLGLNIPDDEGALKDVTLNMPEGVELNAYSATTLRYCSAAQFDASSLAPDSCPTASRLAPVEITTPSVGILEGYAYFGRPTSDAQVLRLYVMAESGPGTEAVRIKFTGDFDLGEDGRMTARLTDLPPVQFTQMKMKFPGGASAPLRTPRICGTTALTSSMVAHHGGTAQTPSATLTVTGADCNDARFSPSASATVSSTLAGADTALNMTITRADGDARFKRVKVAMPPGLLGNLTVVPQCPLATAATGGCSAASEVGTVDTETGDTGAVVPQAGKVYLTAPPSGGVAGLAMVVQAAVGEVDLGNAIVQLAISMSPRDGSLTIEGDVPRYVKGVPLNLREIRMQIDKDGFMRNRSACDAATIATELTSDRGSSKSVNTSYQATNCSALSFTPTLDVTPGTNAADTPAEMSLAVNFPPSGQAQVKDVTVKLPVGVEINPGAGDGLEGCTLDQFAPDSSQPDGCPAASKIGTATVTSPLVGTLGGTVYFGDPAPGKLMRMLVVAQQSAGDGVRIKLIGDVDVDATTGQITTTFNDLPQTPFSQFKLDLQGGKRAVLSTPRSCGTFRADSSLVPYGGMNGAAPTASMSVDAGCEEGLRPAVALQSSTTQAGADIALTTTISRQDGDARLGRIAVQMPDGLLGRLDSVQKCTLDAARTAACPTWSRVGSASTVSGSGDSTITLPGDVFLTDGYDGAIAGLAVAVRAKAGPIDLGTAVVLMKIDVRGNAQGIDITSDPLPTRLQGVPLTLRSITLKIDRDGFMFNATSCGTKPASAAFTSDIGSTATATTTLPTTNCTGLPFAPTMYVDLVGNLKKNSKPAVRASLNLPTGHANVSKVALTLPSGIGADIAALNNMCSREAYDTNTCPPGATVGTATAQSPVLDTPLSGPVTLIKKQGSALPDLGVRLRGPVNVTLLGNVTIGKGNRLITTFDGIPDVPLSTFALSLTGGKKGALVISGNLCTTPETTSVLTAHSGKTKTARGIPNSSPCKPKGKPSRASATVGISSVRSGWPTLKLGVTSGSAPVKAVHVTLPTGMFVSRRSAARATTFTGLDATGRAMKPTGAKVAWKRQTFALNMPKTGAQNATMTLKRGALWTSVRVRRNKQFRLLIRITTVKGVTYRQRVTVRIGRVTQRKAR
jgi:uncharacterized protein YcnI